MRFDPKALAAAETAQFSEVYREHVSFVWRCLRRMGIREADVEDVCQETFVIAHRKFSEFDGSAHVRTWLFGIAMRKASEHRRLKRNACESPVGDLPEQAIVPAQVAALERHDARRLLDGILDSLDEDKRAVFVLYELEQLAMPEVAEIVGCPLQTAYSRLHAAKRTVEASIARLQRRERVG